MASSSPNNREYDFIVYGATGVTGKKVCERLCSEGGFGRTWAIAGRSDAGLSKVLSELAQKFSPASVQNVGKVIADVKNEESLVNMCSRCKVLLNLVGPYRFLGLAVVKAAIQAGTHHIDVSGEPWFLEKAEFDFDDEARKKGVTVVGSCGFDSIPADIGALHLQKQFEERDGFCVYVDSFLSVTAGPNGFAGHATTFECVVHGVSSVDDLRKLRKESYRVHPPAPKVVMPKSAVKATPSAGVLALPFFADKRVNDGAAYNFIFPGSDASIVKRSQTRLLRMSEKQRSSSSASPAAASSSSQQTSKNFFPLQYNAFFTVASKLYVFLLVIGGIILAIFTKFAMGRKLLITYPHLFTFGAFNHDGPTPAQLEGTSFDMTLYGQGFKNDRNLSEGKSSFDVVQECLSAGKPVPTPDMRMQVTVSGPEAGYVATPIYMLEMARMVLDAHDNNNNNGDSGKNNNQSNNNNNNLYGMVPTGVMTPAVAMHKVSDTLVSRLEKAGCKFTVIAK